MRETLVLTSEDGILADLAVAEAQSLTSIPVGARIDAHKGTLWLPTP